MKEEHIEHICPYCKQELASKDFKIELVEGVNYKTMKCKCGRDLKFRVNKEIYNEKDGEAVLLVDRIKFEDELSERKRKGKEK